MAAGNILEQSLPTENLLIFVHLLSPMTYVSGGTIVETENKWFREIISDHWT